MLKQWLFEQAEHQALEELTAKDLRSLLDVVAEDFIELKYRTCYLTNDNTSQSFIGNSGKNWINIHINKKAITKIVVMTFFLLSLSFKLNIIFTNIWSVGIDWIRRLRDQSNQFCCVKLFSDIRYNWSWFKSKWISFL